MDSLTLIDLIDSLLTLEMPRSQLMLNTGYISQITSSGRDLDINQYGFNTGLGYYHTSGLFTTVTGFWYSDFDPAYSLTVASLGYLKLIGKKIGLITSYDHSFYTDDSFDVLNNTINVTVMADLGKLEFYSDYSYYFGNGYANRISPGITFELKTNKFLFFDYLRFRPTFSIIFGDLQVVNARLISTDDANFSRYLDFRPRLKAFLGDNPTQEQIDLFLALYPRASEFFEYSDDRLFGLMNYGFTLPVSMTKGNFSMHIAYTYNIPRALPGELFELSPNDYISLSLSYKFDL
jgi:hypothetical protein